jgi:hypothetical protein
VTLNKGVLQTLQLTPRLVTLFRPKCRHAETLACSPTFSPSQYAETFAITVAFVDIAKKDIIIIHAITIAKILLDFLIEKFLLHYFTFFMKKNL